MSIVDDIQAEADARLSELISYYTSFGALEMHKRPDGVWEYWPVPEPMRQGTTINIKLPKRYQTGVALTPYRGNSVAVFDGDTWRTVKL